MAEREVLSAEEGLAELLEAQRTCAVVVAKFLARLQGTGRIVWSGVSRMHTAVHPAGLQRGTKGRGLRFRNDLDRLLRGITEQTRPLWIARTAAGQT